MDAGPTLEWRSALQKAGVDRSMAVTNGRRVGRCCRDVPGPSFAAAVGAGSARRRIRGWIALTRGAGQRDVREQAAAQWASVRSG
jgi:hypothetical protein